MSVTSILNMKIQSYFYDENDVLLDSLFQDLQDPARDIPAATDSDGDGKISVQEMEAARAAREAERALSGEEGRGPGGRFGGGRRGPGGGGRGDGGGGRGDGGGGPRGDGGGGRGDGDGGGGGIPGL